MEDTKIDVALFVTCLADLFRPQVGFAAIKLLEDAGCRVDVPEAQTCCGQPAYNSGAKADTIDIAKQVIEIFDTYQYVVAPSGSCAGMLKKHYPSLLEGESEWHQRALALSAKTHELTSFLVDILNVLPVGAYYSGAVTYHDSCSGLRELNIADQPRKLMETVEGLTLKEMRDSDVCCGFGGTFCVKYSDISNKIVSNKMTAIEESGADTLVAGDLGCLMNMAGKLQREGKPIKTYHIAEILAGMGDAPGIGEK